MSIILSRDSMHHKSMRMAGYNPKKFYKGLDNLAERGLLRRGSKGSYRFTREGNSWYKKSLLNFYYPQKEKWDGKWRVVLFDIPSEFNRQRNNFRVKLYNMGFYMLQKSVFVFPFPCDEEVARICEHFRISDYVNVIVADSLGGAEDNIKKIFTL